MSNISFADSVISSLQPTPDPPAISTASESPSVSGSVPATPGTPAVMPEQEEAPMTPYDETVALLNQTAEFYQPEDGKPTELLELELAHCRMVLDQQKRALERMENNKAEKRRSSIFKLF